jgi:hypothetical protein
MNATVEKCLVESDYIPELVEICDENDKPYVVGLLAINDLDPDNDLYDPVYLLHDLLVNAAEMSNREALTLIDNAVNAVIEGIAGEE